MPFDLVPIHELMPLSQVTSKIYDHNMVVLEAWGQEEGRIVH